LQPQFLAIGHVVQDLTSDEDPSAWRLGGAASFASLLAHNLGLRTAVLTSAAADLPLTKLLKDIDCRVIYSKQTTQIRNVYGEGGRRQTVPQRATPITLEHLRSDWRQTPVVLLGPVMGEVDEALAAAFPGSLIGVGAQGNLRRVGRDHRVRQVQPADWDARRVLRHTRALFLSDEDIPRGEAPPALAFWSDQVEIVAFTRGDGGAEVSHRGRWRHIAAFPAAKVVDPTGAGDVFAAAFLIRLRESGDIWKATRFAACAASFVVEGVGVKNIPTRAQIDARLDANQQIFAR